MADSAVADTYVPSSTPEPASTFSLIIPTAEDTKGLSDLPRFVSPVQPSDEWSLERCFPAVDPGERPLGQRVVVQIMIYPSTTKGGIALPNDTKDANQDNSIVAKVISCGELAFHNRTTLQPWPEGDWIKVGAYVRVPRYGGLRFKKRNPDWKAGDADKRRDVEFAFFEDLNLIAEVSNPLETIAYV